MNFAIQSEKLLLPISTLGRFKYAHFRHRAFSARLLGKLTELSDVGWYHLKIDKVDCQAQAKRQFE